MIGRGLKLTGIDKSFGDTHAVSGVSFDVQPGETVALLGPSGCGKSTILAIIAGLLPADQGELTWEGVSLENVPAHRRGFGLMFQDYALFPHMGVFDNIAFGLKMHQLSPDEIQARVGDVLELVGLPGFDRRDVNTLSGGEQQRVALARALAPRPQLLMLDEPLGSLDRSLRERLLEELGGILRQAGQTTLYVTHDQEEAFALADRIVLLKEGMVEQIAAPVELYRRPKTAFAARFIGLHNLLPGRARLQEGKTILETRLGHIPLQTSQQGDFTVLLRPDGLHLGEDGPCTIEGRLVKRTFRGATTQAIVQCNGVELLVILPSKTELPGTSAPVSLSFDPQGAVQIFPLDE